MAKASKKTARVSPSRSKNSAEVAAQNDVETQLMQKMGEPNDGADNESAAADANEAGPDLSQMVTMPAVDAFQAAGLPQPSPELAKLWETLKPNDRFAVISTVQGSTGPVAAQEAAPQGGPPVAPPTNGPMPSQDPRQMLLQKIMGGQ